MNASGQTLVLAEVSQEMGQAITSTGSTEVLVRLGDGDVVPVVRVEFDGSAITLDVGLDSLQDVVNDAATELERILELKTKANMILALKELSKTLSAYSE